MSTYLYVTVDNAQKALYTLFAFQVRTWFKIKTNKLVFCAVFAALMAVLSQLSIPLPTGVPVTLQTFTAALCGYFLGSGYGALAMGVYLLMGLAGAPVFSNFRGGAGILIGPTGGFLFTFPALTALCGARDKLAAALTLGIFGTLLCHVCGAGYFAVVTKTAFKAAMLTASLPYLPKDIILTIAAYFLARAIKRAMGTPNRTNRK